MRTETGIDWLSATLPSVARSHEAIESVGLVLFPLIPLLWGVDNPRHGYRLAARAHEPGILIMSGSERMGTHVILSGSALRWLEGRGLGVVAILHNIGRLNGTVSRMDCAIDVKDGGAPTVGQFVNQLKGGKCSYQSKTWTVLESQNDGFTLYLGSRTSERFARIYDKGAEILAKGGEYPHFTHTRIELELKGERARLAQNMFTDGRNVETVVRSQIAGFMSFEFRAWNEIMSGESVPIMESTRKLTDTQKWLLETVAPSLARMAQSDPSFMKRFIDTVLEQAERQSTGA